MKLTSFTINPVCRYYQKKYFLLLEVFLRNNSPLARKEWEKIKQNFFLANWISLYWFFMEHQKTNKVHKSISIKTFNLLANKDFEEILFNLFQQNYHISNQKEMLLLNSNNDCVINIDCQKLLTYLDSVGQYLEPFLLNFLREITPLLLLFSIYDLYIDRMKFIFEYPPDQKDLYEQNIVLLQKQINLSGMIQNRLQDLNNFFVKNSAILLAATLRKNIWKKTSFWHNLQTSLRVKWDFFIFKKTRHKRNI